MRRARARFALLVASQPASHLSRTRARTDSRSLPAAYPGWPRLPGENFANADVERRLAAAELDPGGAAGRPHLQTLPRNMTTDECVALAREEQWAWLARGLTRVVAGVHAEVHAGLLARAAHPWPRPPPAAAAGAFMAIFAGLPEELRVVVSGRVAASAVLALVAAAPPPRPSEEAPRQLRMAAARGRPLLALVEALPGATRARALAHVATVAPHLPSAALDRWVAGLRCMDV